MALGVFLANLLPCVLTMYIHTLYNIWVKYHGFMIEFSVEKSLILQETRGVGFEEIFEAVERKKILDDLKHTNKKYAHQRILVIKKEGYVYAVPYVLDQKRKVIFLKTVYPSRILTNKYAKGGVKGWK